MPSKHLFPIPTKRFKNGAWVILWRYSPAPGDYKQYVVSTGLRREKEDEKKADVLLRRFASILTESVPKFPAPFSNSTGVRRYLMDKGAVVPSTGWLAAYEPIICQEVVPTWSGPSISMLKRLDAFTGGQIEQTTPDQAHSWLASLIAGGLSPARRNRALIMANRFFKWAMRTKRTAENPFAGIKLLKEARAVEIVYCTRAERDRLIEIAQETGQEDWLAVPVAFYAGMRREELYRMKWADIDFEGKKITVPITKTKRLRKVPLNRDLETLLLAVPEARRRGQVAPLPDGTTSHVDRAQTLITMMRRAAKLDGQKIPEKHIGWNVFRHTFGSLLAQGGVSLDKISAYMGNTPEVCRRHYAHFIPRDRHDEDINKL